MIDETTLSPDEEASFSSGAIAADLIYNVFVGSEHGTQAVVSYDVLVNFPGMKNKPFENEHKLSIKKGTGYEIPAGGYQDLRHRTMVVNFKIKNMGKRDLFFTRSLIQKGSTTGVLARN